MHVLQVNIHVKPDQVEAFKAVSVENANKSVSTEPGCLRFDVLQQVDDPSRFMFIEAYRDSTAAAQHKETPHYNHWRDVAEPLMAEPRSRSIFTNLFPPDPGR